MSFSCRERASLEYNLLKPELIRVNDYPKLWSVLYWHQEWNFPWRNLAYFLPMVF